MDLTLLDRNPPPPLRRWSRHFAWVGGWVSGWVSHSPPPPPRGSGTFVGLWACHQSVVGGSLKSPPPPPRLPPRWLRQTLALTRAGRPPSSGGTPARGSGVRRAVRVLCSVPGGWTPQTRAPVPVPFCVGESLLPPSPGGGGGVLHYPLGCSAQRCVLCLFRGRTDLHQRPSGPFGLDCEAGLRRGHRWAHATACVCV